jgi:hypothetical protein
LIELAIGGTEDNEVASQNERNSWIKKWRLPQLFNQQQPSPKDSPPPPSWSKAYVLPFRNIHKLLTLIFSIIVR